MKRIAIVVVLMSACASVAIAQTDERTHLFINVNGGVQAHSQKIGTNLQFTVFGQMAQVATANEDLGTGALIDASVGYRVLPRLGIAAGFSYFDRSGTIASIAVIPSPLSTSQPRTVNLPPVSEQRTERNVYVIAEYFVPVTDQLELGFFAGPSGRRIHQDFVSGLNIPTDPLQTTAVAGGVSARAWGANVGFEANYFFTRRYGAGVFARYNGSSVDVPLASGLATGGIQGGIGARLRF